MDRLNEYLALADAAAREAFLSGLTDEELAELQAAAEEAFTAAEAEAPSDENIAELSALADVIEAVAANTVAREEAAAAREAERAAVIARVRGQEGDGEGDEEGDEAELDADGNPVVPPEVTPPAEGEEETPEAVAAAAAAAASLAAAAPPARPAITQVRARRPVTPRSAPSTQAALVAATDVPGIAAGTTLVEGGSRDFSRLGEAVLARWDTLQSRGEGRHEALIASARGAYPESRQLGTNVDLNMERIEAVRSGVEQGGDAMVAAGGFCAPATIRYDLPVLGESDRPVRDSLMAFGATRGRVAWMPSPGIADVTGAVSQWTEAMDIAALTDPAVIKPCLRVTCPTEQTAELYAVPRCLEFGNFNARTYPEQITAYTTLTGVWHARFAEQLLLAGIDAGSTIVNTGQVLGAASDTLDAVDRVLMGIQSRYRIRDPRLRMIAPMYLRNMIRTDISREIPGGGTIDERMALADTKLEDWLRLRNTSVTWTLDEGVFASQGAGPVIGFPSTVKVRIFLEGTWAFLDGGELNLGIVRDTTTNATNDFQMFEETFEGVAKFGPGQSFVLTMDLCPDGSVSGTVDIDPCTTGS